MAIPNKYYIVNYNDPNLQEIIGISIGLFEKKRMSLDGSLVLIKLKANDNKNHQVLSAYKKYNHVQIKKYFADNKTDWETEIIL